jgi:hypothetical protein
MKPIKQICKTVPPPGESMSTDEAKILTHTLQMLVSTQARSASPQLAVATELCAALMANPAFEPNPEAGETRADATARRAIEYSEALLMAYSRHFEGGKGGLI